jgi:hypothetical protein
MEARMLDAARREFEAELERLLAGDDATDAGSPAASEREVAERLDAQILAGLVSP